MIKQFFLVFFFFLICSTSHSQVLTEKKTDLGFGFIQIEHAQINVAGRWNSKQKFHFLYHQKRRLCQCTVHSISPSGKFAVFQEMGTKEFFLYRVQSDARVLLNKLPTGKLQDVTWLKSEKKAELSILISPDSPPTISTIRIPRKHKKTSTQ